jgi:hypothetical protein
MTTAMARWAGTIGLAAVLAVGCAGKGDDADSSAAEDTGDDDRSEEMAPEAAPQDAGAGATAEAAADEAAGGGTGPDPALTAVEVVGAGRDVVRTGTMQVTVDEVEGAAAEVRALATEADGFVADEQVRAVDDTVDVTVRVPADAFEDVRAGVAELGDVTEQDVQAQDVTAEMVDLGSRITSLRASVERVRGLLDEAGDVAQLALVEGELASRETELEALLGQQRVLDDQVALATLTVHLDEDPPPAPSEDAAGFTDGLRRGWVVLVEGGRFAMTVAGFLLPLAVPGVPAAVAVRWWWLRRRPEPATLTPPRP